MKQPLRCQSELVLEPNRGEQEPETLSEYHTSILYISKKLHDILGYIPTLVNVNINEYFPLPASSDELLVSDTIAEPVSSDSSTPVRYQRDKMLAFRSAFRITATHFSHKSVDLRHLCTAAIGENNAYLLTLLVCPLSKEPLVHDLKGNRLMSHAANIAFPVSKEGCLNMTIFDAYVMGHEGPDASGSEN